MATNVVASQATETPTARAKMKVHYELILGVKQDKILSFKIKLFFKSLFSGSSQCNIDPVWKEIKTLSTEVV